MSVRTFPEVGVLEWFRPGEHAQVEQVIADLRTLGIRRLRTGVSWADWHSEAGRDWYDWLLPRLARHVDVLPCFTYTPPSLGLVPRTASPPKEPRAYADFLDEMIDRFGDHFEWVELWNEPNNLNDWDRRLDPEWQRFSEMVGAAAYWAQRRGKKTVLGGMCPLDPNWLSLMHARGVCRYIDAIGLHGFPGTWEHAWAGWEDAVAQVNAVAARHDSAPEIWITETGYSTWRREPFDQVQAFAEALKAPVSRLYWYSARDLHPDLPSQEGLHTDERHYHFGLRSFEGRPRPLFTLLASGGPDAVLRAVELRQPPKAPPRRKERAPVVVTGGAGFLGTELAHRLLQSGERVRVLDDLSRPGAEENLRWLWEQHRGALDVEPAQLGSGSREAGAIAGASAVFHLAGACREGREDDAVSVHVVSALHVLAAAREHAVPVVMASNVEVLGALSGVPLRTRPLRVEPEDPRLRGGGLSEAVAARPETVEGVSCFTAERYALSHARSYGVPVTVLRFGELLGPPRAARQVPGQIHALIASALDGGAVTFDGDGRSVLDLLFVDDAVKALLVARRKLGALVGGLFHVGAGPQGALSELELVQRLSALHGGPIGTREGDERPSLPRWAVLDSGRFHAATGWTPHVSSSVALARLYHWRRASGRVVRPAAIDREMPG